jgi:hypothetical protein
MAFPPTVIEQAWRRSGAKCECQRISHGHSGRCNKDLVRENRGREGRGKWEAHHKQSGGPDPDALSNCEILCWDCHSRTF